MALFVLSQALTGDIVKSAATIGVFLSGGFRLTAALLHLQNSLLAINAATPSARTAHEILELSRGVEVESSHKNVPTGENSSLLKQPSSNAPIGVKFHDVSF